MYRKAYKTHCKGKSIHTNSIMAILCVFLHVFGNHTVGLKVHLSKQNVKNIELQVQCSSCSFLEVIVPLLNDAKNGHHGRLL